MCPRVVAMDGGKCLLIASVVSPGHARKWLLQIAFSHVALVGLNMVAWRNLSTSGWVLVLWMALA